MKGKAMKRTKRRRVIQSVTANMGPYIQIWNPTLWPWDSHTEDARQTRQGKPLSGPENNWSCGIRKKYETGCRIFIYRVNDNHGIVASGTVSGEVWKGEHWDGSGRKSLYVPIDFDTILDLSEILPRDQLEAEVPFNWRCVLGSGYQVPSEAAGKLENLWKRHLKAIGRA